MPWKHVQGWIQDTTKARPSCCNEQYWAHPGVNIRKIILKLLQIFPIMRQNCLETTLKFKIRQNFFPIFLFREVCKIGQDIHPLEHLQLVGYGLYRAVVGSMLMESFTLAFVYWWSQWWLHGNFIQPGHDIHYIRILLGSSDTFTIFIHPSCLLVCHPFINYLARLDSPSETSPSLAKVSLWKVI